MSRVFQAAGEAAVPVEDPLTVVRNSLELVTRSKELYESARRTVEHSRRIKERIAQARLAAYRRSKRSCEK